MNNRNITMVHGLIWYCLMVIVLLLLLWF